MSEAPKNNESEIEPLSDESLEDVSGGICSWSNCSNSSAAAIDG
jgi:hypothetical protein